MGELPSITLDALLDVDFDALDDDELKATVLELVRVQERVAATVSGGVANLDARGLCLSDGMVSTTSWLVQHAALSGAAAGSQVWLARNLRQMPDMATALAAGRTTTGHARVLARCLGPRTYAAFCRDQQLLVDTACELTADDFGVVVARWLALNDTDGPEPKDRPSEQRVSRYFDGRVKIDGDLDVDDGAIYKAEVDHLVEILWHHDQAADDGDPLKLRSHAQRVAAAQVLMAQRSSAIDRDELRQLEADTADTPRPVVNLERQPRRQQLLVILNDDGTGELDDRTLIPKSIIDRWACDASVLRVAMEAVAAKPIPVDVSENTYTPNRAQRRALIARDRGCVIPGCTMPARWTEAHHVEEFPNGKTTLDNLVLLCDRHHKQIHRRQLRLEPVAPQQWRAVRPDGTPLLVRPPPRLAA